ncbi:uncharacterized protein EAE98_007178 [Botrytis deweyae]|uniref:Uncharacterized protein n=1 Tax=Botrytis deweyae TaxID=2478750 RepID=A0ABQ7II94_9HELO|nr:uncharacterized protein EAE98_007178 [Botrytis deweyae]KAF7925090.1 hypothetical protein EAE98_007178 [Botrytis deweyae]
MSAHTLSQGLAVFEHASISMQELLQPVPLNKCESAKKRVQFLAHIMDEFALSNLEDSPVIRTLHASVDAAFHKAEEDYRTATLQCDEVLRSNDILNKTITFLENQKSLFRKAFEDVPVSQYAVGQSADPSVVDVQESSNVEIEAVADLAATHLPAADLPHTNMTTTHLLAINLSSIDIATTHLPIANLSISDMTTIDLPAADLFITDITTTDLLAADLPITNMAVTDSPAADKPNAFLLKMFGERRHSNNPTIDRLVPTLIRASKSGGAITHGDPHKPVAAGEVDPSTWLVPESTGPSPWPDVSMQVNQTLTYSPHIFSPITVMRPFAPRPTIPPKILKSKAYHKVLKLLENIGMEFPTEFDQMTSEQFTMIKDTLNAAYKATATDCSEVCPSVLSGAICYHQNCEYKYTEACPLAPNCSNLDCPRTHLPAPCPCDWNKASPEHLATVPHVTVRESLNEARVIAWKLHLLDLCGV